MKKMNVKVKKSNKQGKGVFAERDFKQGDFILDIDDSHIVNNISKLTKEQYKFYLDCLARGKIIVMQEPERYINHSCDPNSYVKTISGIRKVFAIRNITKGEEITYNYSINGYNAGTFQCNCGSKNCKGIYQGNFFDLPKSLQIKYLPYLDDWFAEQFRGRIEALRARRKN